MFRKLLIVIYYCFIQFLPGSKFCPICTRVRTIFVYFLLGLPKKMSVLSKIEQRVYFGDFKGVKLGSRCEINEHVFLQNTVLGNDILIAPFVCILSRTHLYSNREIPIIEQGEPSPRSCIVEDDVWLGRNVLVLPGVRICKGAVVGACSVVTRDVLEFNVVAGQPARTIGERK